MTTTDTRLIIDKAGNISQFWVGADYKNGKDIMWTNRYAKTSVWTDWSSMSAQILNNNVNLGCEPYNVIEVAVDSVGRIFKAWCQLNSLSNSHAVWINRFE